MGVVFGPSLIRPKVQDTVSLMSTTNANIIELIIENYKIFFPSAKSKKSRSKRKQRATTVSKPNLKLKKSKEDLDMSRSSDSVIFSSLERSPRRAKDLESVQISSKKRTQAKKATSVKQFKNSPGLKNKGNSSPAVKLEPPANLQRLDP